VPRVLLLPGLSATGDFCASRYGQCFHRCTMEARCRILTVDNEPSVTLSLLYVFSDPRYHVTAAKNGNEALTKLDANPEPYDVIIVDQKMPELTGVELVSAIRKRGLTTKIIVLSAQLSEEVRAAYEQMDVHVMLPKPFDITELRSAVDRLAA
jgi:DNA-binding response OmpR family regulator